jgi:hypothetical protein
MLHKTLELVVGLPVLHTRNTPIKFTPCSTRACVEFRTDSADLTGEDSIFHPQAATTDGPTGLGIGLTIAAGRIRRETLESRNPG